MIVFRQLLNATVAVVDRSDLRDRSEGMDCFFQRIEHEPRRGAGAGLPSDDPSRVGVDY